MTHTITDFTPEDRRRIDRFLVADAKPCATGRTEVIELPQEAPAARPATSQSAAARS